MKRAAEIAAASEHNILLNWLSRH
ncbi:hypothetical protein [Wolbachia pipientis]|nr:hypothetical protein [Wolbachia pipientis]MDM8335481.1 hypothetical protein [Wolbachia pipientis]